MMTDMIIKRTGLTGKSRFAVIVWAVVLSLAYPAPMAVGQATGEGDCRFPDVPATSPAHADITYACRQGWFSGYPDGSFRPDRPVPAHQLATVVGRAFAAGSTRADMATFLRGGAPGDPVAPAGFSDVPATHPQSEDIAYAVERSWFQGYPDNTFRPDRTITARQITTVLTRSFPTASTRADLAAFMRNGQQALNAKNEPQPNPSTTKIAYTVPVYDSLGDKVARELWVADSDGSGARRLTDDVSYYHYEDYESIGDWTWSPDGERIAYEVTVRDFRGNEIGSELWVADADGLGTRQLSDEVGNWKWSPDGKRIAYHVITEQDYYGSVISSEFWTAMADGSDARRLTEFDGYVSWWWSPSGEQIVYKVIRWDYFDRKVAEELWVVGVGGSAPRQITEAYNIRGLQWSPDGRSITYNVDVQDSSGRKVAEELWVVGVDSTDPRRLTDDAVSNLPWNINNWWWSSDGERIVYQINVLDSGSKVSEQLWVATMDGLSLRRLTDDFAYNWHWSPSGERIAFQSRVWEFGRWLGYSLWVAEADGSSQRQVDDDISSHWSWSPSKEMIVYGIKKRDTRRTVVNTELWVARADGSGARRLTDHISGERWGSDWRWSPDGSSIAYEVRVGDSSDNDRELWVSGADGSDARRLVEDIAKGGWGSWGWSPVGNRIAYGAWRDSDGEGRELWVVGLNDSGAWQLTDDMGWWWEWSPDGESIFYGVDVGDSSDITRELWVVGVDGSGARRLTDDVALTEWGLTRWQWSPSGEGFVYGVTVRDSRGNETSTELWVAGADGSRARKLADNFDNWEWQPGEG